MINPFYVVITSILLAFSSLALSQQETGDLGVPVDTDAAKAIVSKLDQLRLDVTSTQMLIVQIEGAASLDREALSYWRDTRSLEVLSAVDKIAGLVIRLPETDPMRDALKTRLLKDFQWIGRSVYDRIDELDQEILKATVENESKQGVDLARADSVLNNLEDSRDAFLRAMIAHIEARKLLALPMEHVLPPLKMKLGLQAESVAGRLVFVSAMIKDLDQRLVKDELNPDLLTARKEAAEWHKHNLERLRELMLLMARLDMPLAVYRSLIAAESAGISVDMIRPDVMSSLIREKMGDVSNFSLKRGPDIALNALIFIGILLLFRLLSRLFSHRVELTLARSSWDISMLLKDTLVKMSGFVVMTIGLLLALAQVGISLGPMLAGLGLAGFILGISLQDTLANFASGAMILLYRPYDVEDFIEVVDASGVVKKMTLVSTTITTFDNQTLVVPNSKIWGGVIKNVTAQHLRRVDLQFGIGYSEDIEKAERILAEAAQNHELVLKTPETTVKVASLGESSVNLNLRPWVKTDDYWTVYWDLTRDVKLRFDRAGVVIPYPRREIYIHKDSEGS